MFEIDKSLEIGFYGIILSCDLAVSFWIKGDWKPTLDDKKIVEQWPEFWGKGRVFIADN